MKIEFKIEENSGHIHIPVYVNEYGPYYFTLDTGAGITTISQSLIEELSIESQTNDNVKAVGVGGSVSATISNVDQLRIGSETFEKEKVAVLDFKSIFGPDIPISGLIGHSILKNYKVSINYHNRILELEKNGHLTPEDEVQVEWTEFRYVEHTHIIAVPVYIDDKGPFELILDTGSSGTIISPKLVKELGFNQKLDALSSDPNEGDLDVCSVGECPGVGGVARGYSMKLKQLAIKSAVQKSPTVGVIDLKLITPNCQKLDYGIIGYPFLKHFKVILDYPNMRLGLIKLKEVN